MQIFHDWHALPPDARGAMVAMGNFDGVHLGHQALLSAAAAARPDLPLAAMTFEPHPREVFRAGDAPFRLTLPAARAEALAAAGVRLLYELRFDAAFCALSAEDFVVRVLGGGLGARALACGEDFAFGHRRGGDVAFLAARAAAFGMELVVVPPLVDAGGPISSSRIRDDLRAGHPEAAALRLGRPWEIVGMVAHGAERGRTIGFPTANIALGRQLEPARGVYAVRACLPDGRVVPGVANIGLRPTVSEGTESRLEVHLFDFAADLYGAELKVALIAFLRPERRFPDFAALAAQIASDAATARRLLDLPPPASA